MSSLSTIVVVMLYCTILFSCLKITYFVPLCSMVVWFLITVILRTALEKMMMLYSPLRFLPLMHFLCREETKSRVVEKQGRRKRNIFCCKLLSMVLVSSHCIQGLYTAT